MWSARHAMDSLLWEAAFDDMGIYPRAIIRDGVETLRTEHQDGWNAAVTAMSKKHGDLMQWVSTLTQDTVVMLQRLLDDDGEPIGLSIRDDKVLLLIRCSDTFMYACSDCEECAVDDLPEADRLWKAHGYVGLIAWIARKRRQEPVKEYRYDPNYLKAKADLDLTAPGV